jgi:L-alanine-DL-glutamate epimerase-like enolase superfamily enzyme
MAGTYERVAGLPLRIEGYELDGLRRNVSSGFERVSTLIRLRGGGHEGVGEDVTYSKDEQEAFQAAGPDLDLSGEWTLDTFAEHVGSLELFPGGTEMPASRHYRRWGFESAALDLALRQSGQTLAQALGRECRPVTFVVSLRLGEPASIAPLQERLDRYPTLRFKLDATDSWDDALCGQLAATGAVDSVDFKGLYHGTVVDQEPDPALYHRVAQAFPDAWLEDPNLNDETRAALNGAEPRITWDANIHSFADVEALPFPPRMVNIKPSRLGSIRALFECYDRCAERGITAYGGGQFELGTGRGQIQYLASIFHPDAPNDIAPTGYNEVPPADGLPESPLPAQPAALGFRWGE